MARREITDTLGRNTGERIARYVWRSKPTQNPVNGRAVRCIVAQDEKGQYWAGARIGRANGQKAQTEFWLQPSETKQQAMATSRELARSFLSTQAELYSDTGTGKRPGEKIVEVTMDDGWSVGINAAGKISPTERRVMALLDGSGKGEQQRPKSIAKSQSRDWPSR